MTPPPYQPSYQLGSLDWLKQKVDEFLEIRTRLGKKTPRLDFCFVAMSRNLDQLLPVAEFAQSKGAPELSIHPIIGRHLVPHDFSNELEANKLRPGFKESF